MTIIELNRREAAPEKSGLAEWCRKVLAEMQAKRRRRQTQLMLSELDQYMLRDIGIEPQDLAGDRRSSSVLFYPLRRPDQRR